LCRSREIQGRAADQCRDCSLFHASPTLAWPVDPRQNHDLQLE
jgi:hypothetical protein